MYFTAFKDLAHLQKYSLNDYCETYMLLLSFWSPFCSIMSSKSVVRIAKCTLHTQV